LSKAPVKDSDDPPPPISGAGLFAETLGRMTAFLQRRAGRPESVAGDLWEMIGQSSKAPICAFDHEFRLMGFNRAHSDEFFRIYGYRVKIGDVFPDLFLPDQAPIIRGFMARALEGEAFSVIEEFGDPSLNRPYWEILYAPLRDGSGRIVGAFHHAQDISARLRAEAELATAQEALRQSQKMEAVGQLTGGIAHDFNNLLMAVSGNLQLLGLRLPSDHPGRRYVDNMTLAAAKGAKLTGQLLAFSRTQKLHIQPVRLDLALRGALDLLGNALGPSVSVELRLSSPDGWVSTDPDQLGLALLNLALNARDALPDGGVIVVESGEASPDLRRRLPEGDYLAVRVVDTGVGMSPEVASRASEPFFTTKPAGKGTGLGLAQVYGFVRQSGGDLRIQSAPSRGAVIEFALPRVDAPREPASEPEAAAKAARANGRGRVVLVVDDDDGVRGLLVETLRAADFDVLEARTGEEGLAHLQTASPVAAIIDFIMPGMNGAEVARRARSLQPALPIIFVSGYFDTVALDGVADAVVLRKPFDLDSFNQAVAAALV
jgi:PAS domain S-box-containing protein